MSKSTGIEGSQSIIMQPNNGSSIPALHAFDSKSSSWQSYRDRIKFYFKANRIIDDDDKKSVFLWSVGDSTYNLLESLISPRSLINEEVHFHELINLLDAHFDEKRNIMTSTFDFYSSYQKPGQAFADWKAQLCDKLRFCGFTTSVLANKPQDRALRDMYVIGVNNPKIRQALLKEQDPTLETTERIIQLGERLQEDIRHFESNPGQQDLIVSKINRQRQDRSFGPNRKLTTATSNKTVPCETCGSEQHVRTKCKYRDYTCNYCKKSGHLERVCNRKKNHRTSTKHIATSFVLNHVLQSESSITSSCTISMWINECELALELDTGSIPTILSATDWRKIGQPHLHQSNLSLVCYSGANLKVKGECVVPVQFEEKEFELTIVVVAGASPPLLGLQWMKAMKIDINKIVHGPENNTQPVRRVNQQAKLSTLMHNYRFVLNKELGHCTKVKAHIQLKPDCVPKFFKPRPLPFAYVDQVKEEIQRQVQAGILKRVDTSPWAAPIVPVKKPNGKIRICGDFKVTINPHICVDQHPIPTIDELLAKLQNGEKFTKLDLSDAYLQVELDDESKRLVVINTPVGLFQYNRMPFGIANAPAVFQRTIDQVIAGIDNCVAYLDDLLITGADDEQHYQTLDQVLSRLHDFGFRCNPEKCSFFQKEVSYLGFIIDKNGKRPDPQRADAIVKMPVPKNVKEVEAFLGKVNYYGKFIEKFSDKCRSLNQLRRQTENWHWSEQCQMAFDQLKNDISKATILAHFDAKLPIILATDASQYGIGAVILHRYEDGSERPIAHASKTLTDAEKNYSQIEKEALSIIYGVKKFHQYLIGRQFELLTDHQPLLSIFNPKKGIPLSSANRLQRWALCLMCYTYTIRYKSTLSHANADALSRLPAGADPSFVDPISHQINTIQSRAMNDSLIDANEIAMTTNEDEILSKVKHFTETKWPFISTKQSPELIPYFNNRFSLSIVQGCLLKDTQVIIPSRLRQQVLKLLHRSHLGTVKMKQLARSYCWWPKMDQDILSLTKSCQACAKVQPMPKPDFKSWDEPQQVWSRVHMDFAGPFWGSKWLLLMDAKSKFPIIIDMKDNTNGTNLINALEDIFDWFGPPESLVTDNGPPFNSYQLKQFYQKYGINHITTPPYHPSSNGQVERIVRSFKEGMLKEKEAGQTNKSIALRNVLRTYRWSPHTATGCSPASLMFHHPIRTALDSLKPNRSVDRKSTKFHCGQLVWLRNHSSIQRSKWRPAVIVKIDGSLVYEARLSNGVLIKCHQNQLRPRQCLVDESSDIESIPDLNSPPILTQTPVSTPNKTSPSTTTSSPEPRRYSTRNRRPPDRFSPS